MKHVVADAVASGMGRLGDLDIFSVDFLCLGVLIVLLVLVATRLHGIHALLLPAQRQTSVANVPAMMLRKAWLLVFGAVFLVFSSDKVSKKQLKKAHATQAAGGGGVEREVRLIFMRHGESVWNYVFNRGFGPSFLVRLVRVTLHELYLLPWDDSAYIDSPLSALGLEQCEALQRFLCDCPPRAPHPDPLPRPAALTGSAHTPRRRRKPCLDPRAEADFRALTASACSSEARARDSGPSPRPPGGAPRLASTRL